MHMIIYYGNHLKSANTRISCNKAGKSAKNHARIFGFSKSLSIYSYWCTILCMQLCVVILREVKPRQLGDRIFVPIRWHLGNLKNTHVGNYWSLPRQSYIEGLALALLRCMIPMYEW